MLCAFFESNRLPIYTANNRLYTIRNQDTCLIASFNRSAFSCGADTNNALHLNFEGNYMEWTDNSPPTSYKEINAKFNGRNILIECSVNFRKLYLPLDPAFPGTALIPNRKKYYPKYGKVHPEIFLLNGVEVSGALQKGAGIKLRDITYGQSVAFAGIRPVIGLHFIKSFNWFVDFERKKVFFVKNSVKLESHEPRR